jgi:predicted DCC family thiol-disulfide oxidoreductase YuxK
MVIPDQKNILLYDGCCKLCSSAVQWVQKYQKKPFVEFVSMQTAIGKQVILQRGINTADKDTVVFIVNGQVYQKSMAVFKVASFLKPPMSFLRYFSFLPLFFMDFLYDLLAKYRYRLFGRKEVCVLPEK